MSRLKEQYQNEIVDAMIKKFGYKNIMEVPKLDKVVINMGVGEAKDLSLIHIYTMNLDGKNKRRGMTFGKTAKTKKAIVQLTEDSKDIEIFEGL